MASSSSSSSSSSWCLQYLWCCCPEPNSVGEDTITQSPTKTVLTLPSSDGADDNHHHHYHHHHSLSSASNKERGKYPQVEQQQPTSHNNTNYAKQVEPSTHYESSKKVQQVHDDDTKECWKKNVEMEEIDDVDDDTNPLLNNDTMSTQQRSEGISECYDGVYFGDSIDDDDDVDDNNGDSRENHNHLLHGQCRGGEYQKNDQPVVQNLKSEDDNAVTSDSIIEYEGVDYSDSDLETFGISKIGTHQVDQQGLQSTQHSSDKTNLILASLQEEEEDEEEEEDDDDDDVEVVVR
jgi:hypothetical protein